MAEITLVAETGRVHGSRPSNRLRGEGKVPAVVYGQGITPVSVSVDRRALRQALTGPAGVNAVLSLKVGDATHPAVVKEMQRHPIRRTVSHVDFLVVDMNVEIEVEVPVTIVGEAEEVTKMAGVIEAALSTLTVRTKPGSIPTEVAVDVSSLSVGDVIRVSDITLPAGVTTPLDPETALVSAVATRATLDLQHGGDGNVDEESAEGGQAAGTEADASADADAE